jgi:hypothetical protein
MTTIAALEGIDYAVLVADSQITEDNLVTLATSTPKIVEVGKFLVGISGDTRPGDILAYNWKPPLYRGEDPAQFMGKKVIPSINTAFNDNNYDYNKVDKDGGFDYLIAFNGNIFRIACDLSFFQANHGAYAIGILLAISLFSKQMSERTALVVEVSLLLAISLQLSSLIWS